MTFTLKTSEPPSPRLPDWQGWAPGIFPDDAVVLVDRPQHAEPGKKNILIMVEPEVNLHLRTFVVQNAHMFDTIWTCDNIIHQLFPKKSKIYLGSAGSSVLTQEYLSPKEFKNFYLYRLKESGVPRAQSTTSHIFTTERVSFKCGIS